MIVGWVIVALPEQVGTERLPDHSGHGAVLGLGEGFDRGHEVEVDAKSDEGVALRWGVWGACHGFEEGGFKFSRVPERSSGPAGPVLIFSSFWIKPKGPQP